MKYLLLLVLLGAAWFIFKAYSRKSRRGQAPGAPRARGEEDMVRCAECGVHLPRSESITSGRAFYCSAEHRRLRERAD